MNLLQEIYDRLLFEQLIAEGKDPREILHYKYQNVPSELIDKVIEIDPTKKKSYSQWLLSKWDKESDTIVKNLKNGRIEKLFRYFKERQDIQIKDFSSVGDVLRDFIPEEDTVLTKSSKPMTYVKNLNKEVPSELANDFDIVYDDGSWIIAVPNTYEAECKLGENMQWCTANGFGRGGESYYQQYLSRGGKYYVNFDMTEGETRNGKDYPFKRYQFHFESRQFMDMDDDPVMLEEIGMPDGAIEYYDEEGYDITEYENDEVRYDRYIEQRENYNHYLNDDLYLCFEFDDDYEFEEPNADTPFYIFDHNDERDPISWDRIPNPYHHHVELFNGEESLILDIGDERNSKVLVFKTYGGRNRDWATADIRSMLEIRQFGYFCVVEFDDGVERYTFIEDYDGCVYTGDEPEYYIDRMFVNEACGELYDNYAFVEIVNDDKSHTLYEITDEREIRCVVMKDTPVNGEYFEINEEGIIEGNWHSYRATDDESDGDEEDDGYIQWQFVKELPSGDYQVFVDERYVDKGEVGFMDRKNKYNILRRDTKEPMFEWCFCDIDIIGGKMYRIRTFINHRMLYGVFTFNGEQIGEWYEEVTDLDPDRGFFLVKVRNNHGILNAFENKIVVEFRRVLGCLIPKNTLVVGEDLSGKIRCFDYINNKFCYEDLNIVQSIYYKYLYLCITANNDQVIMDFANDKCLSSGNVEVNAIRNAYISPSEGYYQVKKADGTYNIFYARGLREVLPYNADMLISVCQNYNYTIVIYRKDGRDYIYDFEKNNFIINPNGFVNMEINCSTSLWYIYFKRDGITLEFTHKSDGTYILTGYRTRGLDNMVGARDLQTLPQEVREMYAEISGQQTNVIEQFRRMTKRINEAMRLSMMDLVD